MTYPQKPGVYLHKDSTGRIIYVGKAKNLKNRIASYFTQSDKSPKTQHLVERVSETDYIITDTEVEALLLENKLIKQHKPKYNIHLKDAKTFAYLKVTEESYPRLVTARRVTKKGAYYGPYTDGLARRELQRLANKLFKLRTCKTMPKRECLNYHIGLCTAPCTGRVSKEEYQEQVGGAKELLRGRTRPIKEWLEKEMRAASHEQRYEVALERRDQLRALEHLGEKQKVDSHKRYDQDVIAIEDDGAHAAIIVMPLRKGVLRGKRQYSFESEEELFESFLKRYYSTRAVPHEIITNETLADKSVREYLERLANRKVKLTRPQRGEKRELLALAKKNLVLEHEETKELQARLNLPSTPRTIECFDVSNLGREAIVAGMTRYVNGSADVEGYRRFLLSQGGQDDFGAMREAIKRRYESVRKRGEELPDLVIVDGGRGQLSAALAAMRAVGVKIPVVALAKQEEELYVPGRERPYRFDTGSKMMLYLRRIRDSTHKQAITYNRKRREMRLREDS